VAWRPSGLSHTYLVSIAVLVAAIGALNAALTIPARVSLEENRGQTYGGDAFQFQLMKLRDGRGRMPVNPYGRAKSQVERMKWSAAATRVEQAPAPAISPEMFVATAPASTFGPPLVSPQSWRWLGPGNIGGRIRSIVVHPTKPDTIFAGSVGGGIWKTTNGGASWAPLDDFMAVLSVSSLVISPVNASVMFAGTGEGYGNADSIRGAGIFTSADGGTSWKQLAESATQFSSVTHLAISPNGKILMAATNTGLWRSTNGSTFSWINTAISPQDVRFHPTDSNRAVIGGYGAIKYSADGGLSWRASTGLPSTVGRIELAYSRSQPDTVYALCDVNGGTLYRSGDGGANFSLTSTAKLLDNNQGWYDAALWVNPKDSNHVVTGGVYLRQTFDGGSTWQSIGATHADQHAIVEDPRFDDAVNKTVFVGNDGGVSKNVDIRRAGAGSSFTSLNNNLGVTQFYGGAGNASSGTILGGTQDNGTVVFQPGNATNWSITLGSDGGFVASDPADPSHFYAEMIYLSLFRSDNGGREWSWISANLPDTNQRQANFIAPFVLDPNDSNRMLAGGASLWRSSNVKSAPPAWKAIMGSAPGNPVSAIAIAPEQPDLVWVGRNLGQVYRSTNATAATPSFTRLAAPTAGNFVTRIAINPFNTDVVYVTTGGFGSENVLKTLDGGTTWCDATGAGATGLPDAPVNDLEIDPAHPDTIYAATEVGVFISLDGGATWDLPQDGPANVAVDELFWLGSTLIAATHGRGMFAANSTGAAAGTLTASSTQLDFGSELVATESARRRITIANGGPSPVTVYRLNIEGANPHEYAISGTCWTSLAPKASCFVDVSFKPQAQGQRTATIVVVSNATNTSLKIPLRGLGVSPTLTSLPAPWSAHDIGSLMLAGSVVLSQGVFTVNAAGADVWGTADALYFVHQTLHGDGTIIARVASVENVHRWTKAGVMIRNGLTAGAANATIIVSPGKGVSFQYRTAADGATANAAVAGTSPRWVKLTRAGNLFTASTSTDATTWTKVGTSTIAMAADVEIGLAVTSHDAASLAAATFDNVKVVPVVTLPAGWQARDIGKVGAPGLSSASAGVFTISGSGADIWDTSDAFQFAYKPLAGDGELVAHVVSLRNTHRWAKAAVMIRGTTSADSTYAAMLISPAAGSAFQYRTTVGGEAKHIGGSGVAAPYWLKIARAGTTISGYQSSDGVSWTLVGRATISMGAIGSPVSIGLAVTSHDITKIAEAVFDRVR
jgi:regulation of enolase protein 1 (concanavalin A-like superfamily)